MYAYLAMYKAGDEVLETLFRYAWVASIFALQHSLHILWWRPYAIRFIVTAFSMIHPAKPETISRLVRASLKGSKVVDWKAY